jgi:hypothetical protein
MAREGGSVETLRVILANEPRLLREMLKRVFDRAPDFQPVAEVTDTTQLASAVERANAHWVIVSLPRSGEMPDDVGRLATAHPDVGFIGLADDASVVKARIDRVESDWDNPTLEELLTALHRYPTGDARIVH